MGIDFILIGFVVVLILTRYSSLLNRPQPSQQDNAITATAIVERLLEATKLPAEPGQRPHQAGQRRQQTERVGRARWGDSGSEPEP